ncbi:hypothetical protein D041_4169B, partial [Vibrio parahaemolyticus EKP-008]
TSSMWVLIIGVVQRLT